MDRRERRRRRENAIDWLGYTCWTAVGTAVLATVGLLVTWLQGDNPPLIGTTAALLGGFWAQALAGLRIREGSQWAAWVLLVAYATTLVFHAIAYGPFALSLFKLAILGVYLKGYLAAGELRDLDLRRRQRDQSVDEQASILAGLPRVKAVEDVATLGSDANGVSCLGLNNEILAALAERLPGLRVLASDGNSRVTDAGLTCLRCFEHLEYLDLEWSAVSDAGLSHIAAVDSLRWVDLGGCEGVTATGLARLRAARPDLEVEPHDR